MNIRPIKPKPSITCHFTRREGLAHQVGDAVVDCYAFRALVSLVSCDKTMIKESPLPTAKSTLIALIVQQLWPPFLSISLSASLYLYSRGAEITTNPKYPKYSLVLLAILLCTTILCLIWSVRLYWRFGKFRLSFGVLWDKDLNMHCTHCHKFLKHSSHGPNTFYCSNIKCNNKHILKDDDSNPLTKQQAIDMLRNS